MINPRQKYQVRLESGEVIVSAQSMWGICNWLETNVAYDDPARDEYAVLKASEAIEGKTVWTVRANSAVAV